MKKLVEKKKWKGSEPGQLSGDKTYTLSYGVSWNKKKL